MAEYIDREALKEEILHGKNKPTIYYGAQEAEWIDECIKNAPIADVQEVRHGKWEKQQNGKEKCSDCGCGVVFQTVYGRWEYENYCPHCGAKMDKGCEEND